MALITLIESEFIPESQANQVRTTEVQKIAPSGASQSQTANVDWALARGAVAISATRATGPSTLSGAGNAANTRVAQPDLTTGTGAYSSNAAPASNGATPAVAAPFLSSAVMISPTIGLTTAHSLHDTIEAYVIDDMMVRPQSRKIRVKHKAVHPDYKGNSFNGVDLAVFMLESPMKLDHVFTPIALDLETLKDEVLQRIGFGEREKQNRRTWILENFRRRTTGKHYLTSEDKYGYPGDSGGPVYRTRDHRAELVGIHVGRMVDDDGKPLDESNTLMLTPELLSWVERTTATWKTHPSSPETRSAPMKSTVNP